MTSRHPLFLVRLLIVILSCFSFGFVIETPESIREEKLAIHHWHKQVKKRYNLRALHGFLVEQVKVHPSVDSIDLAKSTISKKWKSGGMVLVSGDWIFDLREPTDNTFTLTWTYQHIPNEDNTGGIDRVVRLKCTRTDKNKFFLQAIERTDDEYVILIP